jgi:hypothetical protein
MQVMHPVCCGIDGHAAQLTACLRRVSAEGQITTELVDCGTTYSELVAFRTWLQDQKCPVVALESTGVYTPPKMLPKRYWSGNMALRWCVLACSCARKSSGTHYLATPYRPTKAPVRTVQEYRMAKPSSQRHPPPEVTVMFEPHRLQHDLLQAVYILLVPAPQRRLTAKPGAPIPPRVQPRQGGERSVS